MVVIDPLIPEIVLISFVIFALSFLLTSFKFPSVIVYIIAGIIIGPYFLAIVTDTALMNLLGNLGVILLLFFIGAEISIRDILKNWKISFYGTILEILLSVGAIFLIGNFLGWPLERIVLIGFVISLSSTAIVLKILETNNEINTKVGKNVLGILVVQDIMAIPMIIILSLLGTGSFELDVFARQIFGMIIIFILMLYIIKKKEINIPFINYIKKDKEMQIFASLGLCFGFAYLTSIFGLSSALGAFIAGIVVSSSKEMKKISNSISSFYIVLVSIFFLSIGLLLDVDFFIENIKLILILTLISYILNIVVNTISLRVLGLKLREALYSGILLSHIGEFSYVLAAIGISSAIISEFGYNLAISVISTSMLISPILVSLYKFFEKKPLTKA